MCHAAPSLLGAVGAVQGPAPEQRRQGVGLLDEEPTDAVDPVLEPGGRPGDAERGEHAVASLDGCGDTGEPGLELVHGGRVALPADRRELGGERLAGGDRAGRAALEPAGRDGQHVEGVEHLAQRRAVRGYVDLVPVARRQQERRLDLGDVHDVLAATYPEVDGLAGLLADGLQDRPGQPGDLRPGVVQRGVQREQRTGDVAAGGVALDELGALEGGQQPGGRGAGQAGLVAELGEAQRLVGAHDQVDQRGGAVDRLGACRGGARSSGPRVTTLFHDVEPTST